MQNGKKNRAFTLIELLIVLSIVALLITIATPKYFNSLERAKENTLKQELQTLREGIDKFHADTGKYPESLEDLVEKKYINRIPKDPITEDSSTWIMVAPEPEFEGKIYDIHSGSEKEAADGTRYGDW